MDTPEPDTPRSHAVGSGDLFGDEDAVGGLLKSLINPTGLQSAWKRIAKRLQVSEKGLKAAQERLETLPVDFVTRSEWAETVVRKHEDLFDEQGKAIQRLDELTSNTSETLFKELGRLQDCLERTEALERWRTEANPIIQNVEARAEALADSVRAGLDEGRRALQEQTDKSNMEIAMMKEQVKGGLDSIAVELKALEARMKDFTTGEVKRVTDDLMDFDPAASGPSPQQAGMLHFVTTATATLKADLGNSTAKLEALVADCGKHREETHAKFRIADKATVDVSLKLRETCESLEKSLERRVKKDDIQQFRTDLTSRMGSLTEDCGELRSQVTVKLNEFCDHFKKVQDAMDDHEHCLRHHAEEIENRASKYDVLICQNQIDKAAKKDDFVREAQELRQMLNWQSGKIESFGLLTSGMGVGGKASFRASHKKFKKASRASSCRIRSPATSVSSTDASMHQVREGGSEGRRHSHSIPGSGPPSQRGSVIGEKLQVAAEAAIEANEKQVTSLSVWSEAANASTNADGAEEEEEDYDSEEEMSEEDWGASSIVKQQLEAVTMALVGLGHLLLREQKLGQTRDGRLRQEREMLSELQNLRYWVTNRIAKAGWDPTKITTMALACAHPRDDELKRPLPQVSLKGIMQQDDPMGSVRRLSLPAEEKEVLMPTAPRSARGAARPKMGPSTGALVADHLSKAPLTARGANGGCAGSLLPPLQGLSAVAA